ncbi:sporulation/spore germination protein [Sphaerochaeta pleomorpha str. Grapes]|uniref:Sporulation/spore germination protein n=1 Tax=Sphaerochaeta pleomorpha (strain ATCC BAA-1885 / DSM 22778 / Grapes) TaxID=158190 RepID=G8QRL8_SPHPG|nr:GerMN domain-containing protein [Sphaerochaeta pleomorpha]AEV29940.1 sporulation/spore germination protein [Sphaerochaeta pleomorpha str. Grapes]
MDREKDQGENNEAPQAKKKKMLVAWIAWVLFSIAMFALTGPSIIEAVKDSGILELMAEESEIQKDSGKRTVDACFVSYDGSFVLYSQKQKPLGGSVYHDCIESLLSGPDYTALSQGAVTFIAPKTSLIGLTFSNGVLYIDLSKEFLKSPDLEKAYRQIKLTATDFSRVKDVIILVEGSELPRKEDYPT